MEEYGKICGFYLGSKSIVILSDLEMIKKVYKTEEASLRPKNAAGSLRFGKPDGTDVKGILFSSGPAWREQRRFALKNLKDFGFGKSSMEEMIQHEALKLCTYLHKTSGQPTHLDSYLNISIVNALWKILVGEELDVENPSHLETINIINKLVRSSGGVNHPLAQIFPPLVKMFPKFFLKEKKLLRRETTCLSMDVADVIKTVRDLTTPLLHQHKQSFDQNNLRDFADVHIQAQLEAQPGSSFHGEQGAQNLEINLLDLMIAGSETTSTTITWGILYLLHHPDIQERLHEELDSIVGRDRIPTLQDEAKLPYMSATLHEIQRSSSIVHIGVPHRTDVDIELDSFVIPAGSTIFANIMQVMHNPEVFKDPLIFNPSRFIDESGKFQPNPNVIPFLVGKRICLGSSLAEKELFLFFSLLLHTFSFHPVPEEKLPSYSTKSTVDTSNTIIRFCPKYSLIVKPRN
ncbi:cytochrome P450 2C15 [Eurytemora carolleeae]|uniref:cytochrome P450 2C15 n=1 Tax=Eurytemora carolleeae TaxID=1294199 RepID=UPI000C760AA0|nr:cytochrome P450 2C15 [Eurytemora carolleeae]|eukprot:XP_023347481.1 cytochrome P450 2C15-like [Eurytemora affinis]